jgi:hypothetical protein
MKLNIQGCILLGFPSMAYKCGRKVYTEHLGAFSGQRSGISSLATPDI